MSLLIEILHALAYIASTIYNALRLYEWWKEHKQPDSEGRQDEPGGNPAH